MKIKSLRNHIIALLVFFLVTVQVAGFALIDDSISKQAKSSVLEDLEIGARVFQRVLAQQSEQLAQAARVLVTDYGFREAIAKFDRETAESALANHGDRIGADLMMLIGPDKKVLAQTGRAHGSEPVFPHDGLIAQAEQTGWSSAILVIDQSLYQVVVIPVRAPLPSAWVAFGFAIDSASTAELARLTSLQISFVHKPAGGAWRLAASTLPPDLEALLLENMRRFSFGHDPTSMFGTDFHTRVWPLTMSGSDTAVAVLQRSRMQAERSFGELQDKVFLLSIIGMAICLAGSLLIARSAMKPIARLAEVARAIGQRNYADAAKTEHWEETGVLTTAFNDMRNDIVEISKLVYKDSLTGLPNRALFNDRLQQAISAARRNQTPMSVLMMDLDNFKYVNDTLGHHTGDLLLRQVADRLSAVLTRDSDTIARLGGDEFAMLLPNDDIETAQTVAYRILKTLEQPFTIEGQVVDSKGSIGIASCPEHGLDASALMRKADVAMYSAKRSGGGLAVYDAEDDEHAAGKLSLLGELRRAVENDELELYYQPGVDLTTGNLVHLEALVRWRHPQRGLISPDQFIPFAENAGFIDVITREVLRKAFRQSAEWRGAGMPLTIAVNMSARDLLNPDLLTTFTSLLEEHATLPRWIKLEITESCIMNDPERAQKTLKRLREMGFTLSIDDFGTGYSSLAYLKKLPVDEFKIDKSFVIAMLNDAADSAIVRSTIELGHNLGLKVVAEGVEDQATLKLLQRYDCDIIQGYFISRPLPAEAIPEWVAGSILKTRQVCGLVPTLAMAG